MAFVPGRTLLRTAFVCCLVTLSGLVSACAGGSEDHEEPTDHAFGEAVVSAEEAPQAEAAPARPFLPVAMARSTRSETFPHDAHAEIVCLECHQRPTGHGTHAQMECGDCHRNSAGATRRSLSRDQCMACHHGANPDITCGNCHDGVEPMVVTRTLNLEAWSGPRSKQLPFDHGIHEETCRTCHTQAPFGGAERSCASCHEYHHRPAADCAACHGTELLDVHDLAAHQGCSAAGCHADPIVEAMSTDRNVCLACHQEQREHRPGRDCAECHLVRTGGAFYQPPFVDAAPQPTLHPGGVR